MHIFSADKYTRNFLTMEEIAKALYSGSKPTIGHISIGIYPEEAIQYKAVNGGSIAKYNGALHGDIISIDADLDIDKMIERGKLLGKTSSEMFPIALMDVMNIWTTVFNEWDEQKIEYYYFFSGNKGFSIYISKRYFSGTDKFEGEFGQLCKSAIYSLQKKYPELKNDVFTLDIQPYSKVGMLRAPFTRHEKTDKVKYQLKVKENGKHGTIDNYETIGRDWIKDKALYTNILLDLFSVKEDAGIKICELEEQFVSKEYTVTTREWEKPYMMESCIWSIWKEGATSARGRALTQLRLASWCAKKRFNASATMEILLERNAMLVGKGKGALPDKEIVSVLKGYETYRYNFCKDEICLEFCPKSKVCPFYESAQGTNLILSPMEAVEALAAYDILDKSKVIRWDSLFPGLKGDMYPALGHIGTIGAASGTGKTQVALQLALINNHVNWIFWSYEQPVVELMKRLREILGLENERFWKEILHEKTKHMTIIRNGNICIQDRMLIKRQLEMVNNIKISAMASDYIGIIPVRHEDTGKILSTDSESIPIVAKIIKDNAVKEEVVDIVTVQPKDAFSAHGAVMLESEHLKYGAIIQSMSDAQITLNRPNLAKDNDCLCAFETKNREGRGRSTSVVELQDCHIVQPKLYRGSFTLFRNAEDYIKSIKDNK
jgi:hypothetical protein